jgi:hypothetical protein
LGSAIAVTLFDVLGTPVDEPKAILRFKVGVRFKALVGKLPLSMVEAAGVGEAGSRSLDNFSLESLPDFRALA